MKIKVYVSLLLIFVLSMLSACGDDDSGDDQPDTATDTTITIGIINPTTRLDPVVDGFQAGMAENGYADVTYIYNGAFGGDSEALQAEIAALLDANVDLILALATPPAQAVKAATTEIPVVFAPITDPVGAGLVDSLHAPGGNLTGISVAGQEPPRLQWLRRMSADIERVYAVYNPDDAAPAAAVGPIEDAAAELDMEMVWGYAATAAEMEAAAAGAPDDIDAILIMPDSLAVGAIGAFGQTAFERQIPLASAPTGGSEDWALLTYGFDTFEVGRQSARLASQILDGVAPADLPVEQAEFFLTVNLQVAEQINFAVSDDVLSLARNIIYPDGPSE